LNFYDKLHRLEHQAALNENVKANSVQISLNFEGADQLDKRKLTAIADTYMQQIGFGNQPYLVYEHKDAGHNHIGYLLRAIIHFLITQNIGHTNPRSEHALSSD
jgi:hypothetical protein